MDTALLLPLLFSLLANAEPDFASLCQPALCGPGSGPLSIRFPLRLRSDPPACGLPDPDLTCSADRHLLLHLPSLPPLQVTAIDYQRLSLTVLVESGFVSSNSSCPLRNASSLDPLRTPTLTPILIGLSLVSCPQKFVPGPGSGAIAGPITCLDGPGFYVYAVSERESMDVVRPGCMVVASGVQVPGPIAGVADPYFWTDNEQQFRDAVKGLGTGSETTTVNLTWDVGPAGATCGECEMRGENCGFDFGRNESVCVRAQPPHSRGYRAKIITGTSVGAFLALATAVLIIFYVLRRTETEKEARLKVEKFLAAYQTSKPARYTYSDIKKITSKFKHELGRGGFGTVYRGRLAAGIPIAVKMLHESAREAEEFINEVAIMGRIHHVNVVRLLGFCSEGAKHALVYEFMPNGSLEKYIFSDDGSGARRAFGMAKLQDIALGVARGIEYLHQGCDQRILHFDIKPHNILLDHDFNPKISDFGLAKLCARNQSIVTMTTARGTMGYIAPEIYSRNFGTVSYKSDVYSFGMLLFEMVSGRRNVDPEIENRGSGGGEVYFPKWVYDRLVEGEDLGLGNGEEEEVSIAKKIVMVALWCIQWSPTDRPAMSRVVQLLMGSLESLEMPPKPFASIDEDDGEGLVDVVVDGASQDVVT